MDLVTPGIGMIFWSSLIFILLLGLLGRFAWKPILGAVKNREESIRQSLTEAENARKEMQNIKADNERILVEARKQRDQMLNEAKKLKEQIIDQAKQSAETEANKIVQQAKTDIEREKNQMAKDLKNQLAEISISVAETILKRDLSDKDKQEKYIEQHLKDINLN